MAIRRSKTAQAVHDKILQDKKRVTNLLNKGLSEENAFQVIWRENKGVITLEDVDAADILEWRYFDTDEVFETNRVLEKTPARFRILCQLPSAHWNTWEDDIPKYGWLPPNGQCLATFGRLKSSGDLFYLVIKKNKKLISFRDAANNSIKFGI